MSAASALVALSSASLMLSAAYLWHALRDVPVTRRLGNLLLPGSQLLCVLALFAIAQPDGFWEAPVCMASAIGIVSALGNLSLYRSAWDAENLEYEQERTRLLEEQVVAQQRGAERMAVATAEAREIRTRLLRELSLVAEALEHADGAAVRNRLAGASDVLAAPRVHVCQHPAADAIIMSKLDEAEAAGVRISVSAQLPFDIATPAVELCAVIANALDNAIEACRALPPDARWIELAARTAHGFVSVECRNSCPPKAAPSASPRKRVAHEEPGELPRHGWGLSIVEGVARRHAGAVEYGRSGDAFRLSAIWELDREGRDYVQQ